jgi:3-phenylpropionate/trans-cinnamate dioxygenase ferredoxin reductase subunit
MQAASSGPGIIIIGAGEAGTRAALTLREHGYTGAVTLIGAEGHPPYERPPLSKAVQTEAAVPDPAVVASAEALAAQDISYLPGQHATGIDREVRRVTLDSGEALAYSRLLLATGARPRTLSLPGAEDAGLLYLRTFSDALALRERLRGGCRIVIIGGGFIGLEIAASARALGCAVTVVEMAPRILGRAVPALVAARVADHHRASGITLLEGAGLAAITPRGARGADVHLADGRVLEAESVVVGIGAIAETALAEAAGLAIENGIRVDGRLATSDPAIFAAGDCCSFPHPVFGGRRLRLEAWRNAQDQGRHVAGTMLGETTDYAAIPWFWSDQLGQTLQIAGLPDEGDETIIRGLDGMPFLFHLKAGRLVGASAFGPLGKVGRDIRLAEMLIAAGASPDRAALADPAVRLRTFLTDRQAA